MITVRDVEFVLKFVRARLLKCKVLKYGYGC